MTFGYISVIAQKHPVGRFAPNLVDSKEFQSNYLWQKFWWSVKGGLILWRSYVPISHWQSQLLLTLYWCYRAAIDDIYGTVYDIKNFAYVSAYINVIATIYHF